MLNGRIMLSQTILRLSPMALTLCLFALPSLAFAQDSDGDGLSDADETNIYMSNINSVDTDGDGLSDSAEVLIYQTNPILKDSDSGGTDDYTEVLSGTNPNLNTDDGTQPVGGTGTSSTWILSPATMGNVAQAESRFNCLNNTGRRSFVNDDEINYTDQAGPHGPFGTDQIQTQDVWGGTDPSFYVFTFSGGIIVPPATASNPNNIHTFAASTDDGFRLRIFDGTTVQTTQFDANRGMGTGPLIAVDFPDEGGVFPYDFLVWEQGGAVGAKLSWAPGTQTTFSEATFSLIPSTNLIAPNLTATQTVVDINGGTVAAGDTLEATVTIRNNNPATAYNVRFTPNTLGNLTFGAYGPLPAGASINGANPQQLDMTLINPNQTISFTYQVTAGAAGPYTMQGFVQADTSPIATVGSNRVCLITDDPVAQEGTDTGNLSQNLFANGQFDDDPNSFNINDDLTPPTVAITNPANAANLDSGAFTAGGSTEAGATVQVRVLDANDNVIVDLPAMVDAAGNWSLPVAGLTDGDYTITATATDASGNSASTTNTFNVDTVDPTLTVTAPSDGDATNDNTPAIEGTTEAGAVVTVVIKDTQGNTIQTLTPSVDASGDWSVDAAQLPDGDYTIEVSASDAAGNTTNAPPIGIVVDTVTAITIVTPAMANTTTNDNTPTISGNAEPGASITVTFTDANGMIQTATATAANNGAWSVDAPQLNDGSWAITATSSDAAGNTASANTTLTVDTQDPTLVIATPSANSATNDTTPTISGTTEANATVALEIRDSNGTVVETLNTTADNNGNWTVDAAQLTDGTYTVAGVATDAAGNTGIATPQSFTVDTVAPTITLDAPANGSTTNDNTPNISGTSEAGAAITVLVSDANGLVQTLTATADGNGAWNVDAAQLPDGDYTITATAQDAGGNTSMVAGPNSVSVDTAAPAVTLDTPTDGAQTNDNTVTIAGTADTDSTVVVRVLDGNGTVVATLSPMVDPQSGAWTVDTSALPDGSYTTEVTATDLAGNNTTAGPNGFVVDTTAPAVTLDTPASGTFTNNDTPTISGTADAGTTLTVTILDDQNNVVQTLNPTVDNNGDWTVDAAQLAEGTYTVSVEAQDAANNTGTAGPNTFAIDLTDPNVAINNPADGSLTANPQPTINGTADASSTVVVEVKDAAGNTVHTATVTANAATGAWTVDDINSDLPDGAYTIEATATDLAGNTASTTGGFTIDTSALPLTIGAPTTGSVLTTTPDITGTTAAGEMVTIVVTDANGAVVQTLTVAADANGDWTTALNMLADGNYTATASVTNAAGTTTTETTDFTVDATAPALTVTTPANNDITNDNTPEIAGSTEPGATVTVIITDTQGNVVETLTPAVDAMGNWSIEPTATLNDGDYVISVESSDAAGNTTNSGDINVSVDTAAPALDVTAPTDNQLVTTRDTDVTGTADAGQQITVEVLDANGIVVDTQTVTADANGDWTASVTNLANGDYTVRATATDLAGNIAEDTTPFTVDSDEPIIQINNPADGSATNNKRPSIDGLADADATVTVTITDNAGNVIAMLTPTVNAMGMWSIMPDADLADGEYTIEAQTTRPNGKSATASATVTIDTDGPTVSLTSPADGSQTPENQPAITGTSEPNTDVTITVTNAAGTVIFETTVTTDANGNFSVTPDTMLADDTYTISATGTDAAGNEGTPSTATVTIDTNAPMIAITSPSNDDTIDDNTPTITGTAAPGSTVEIFVDGNKVGEATTNDQGNWTFELPEEDAIGVGEHTIEAKTTDEAGNEGSSGQITITVEDPKEPVVITSPGSGVDVTGPSVTIEGTGEPGEEVTVTIGGEEVTVTVGPDGTWSATVDNVPNGETTITAKSGNDETTVTVTVVPPTDNSAFVLRGAGCSSASTQPAAPSVMMTIMLLMGLCLRRRRR